MSKIWSAIKSCVWPAVWGFAFFMWGSYCARGYVQRHEAEIYREGAHDMEVAIFAALDRVRK
jgi:hypothetical protein